MSASRTRHSEEDGTDVEYITGRPQTIHIEQPNTRPDFSQKKIPDTPCAASVISFLLGGLFAISLSVVYSKVDGLLNPAEYLKPVHWWATSQNAFFFAAWSFFHWAEYAVTAGWNRKKCSVDCMYCLYMPCWLANILV